MSAFVVCAVISWFGWVPLSVPAQIISALVPKGNCGALRVGSSEMYLCSAIVGAEVIAGPLAIIVLIFLIRSRLANALKGIISKLPRNSRFLAAPVVSTILFTIVWAGIHYTTADSKGIVPQKLFPALIGFFTFVSVSYGEAVQRIFGRLFAIRDVFPKFLRVIVALLIPIGLSFWLTNQETVTQEALKEQFVALVALAVGYLAVVPRSKANAAGARPLMNA